MREELLNLVERLSDPKLQKAKVISWSSPVISFGNIDNSKIATLGLNPSDKEFIDNYGKELKGKDRRFHTLSSLGITKWSEVKEEHLESITELCYEYFCRNPYDNWFKRLDYIISGTSISYYLPSNQACHLDLIPYATSNKWAELTQEERSTLLQISGDTLGLLLRRSSIKLLVLNGQSVVDHLQKTSNIILKKSIMPSWTLPRKNSDGVIGYSYTGATKNIGGVELPHEIMILGYNHNIQSSFGVTSKVQTSIRNWISKKAKDIII